VQCWGRQVPAQRCLAAHRHAPATPPTRCVVGLELPVRRGAPVSGRCPCPTFSTGCSRCPCPPRWCCPSIPSSSRGRYRARALWVCPPGLRPGRH
jgi:hypothetical protein